MISLTVALALLGWFFRPTPPAYTVTDLGTLPGDNASSASAINNHGEIVGQTYDFTGRSKTAHTFLYRSGKMTALVSSVMYNGYGTPAINDRGQVAGHITNALGVNHAFLYSKGKLQDLGTLSGFPDSFGMSLNNRGEVAGGLETLKASRVVHHAFFYSNGRMHDLGVPSGVWWEDATGINDTGQVAESSIFNTQAFICDIYTGSRTALSLPPGFTSPRIGGINNRGKVIGGAVTPDKTVHAALWSGGVMSDIGRLNGADYNFAIGINTRDEAVGVAAYKPYKIGSYLCARLHSLHPFRRLLKADWRSSAFVYKDGKLSDLNDLISPNDDWTLEEAHGINDQGQIVGEGLHHGQGRRFLLTPMP